MEYFYTDLNFQAKGPVSLEQLRALAESGAVNGASLIAPVGSQQWSPIGTILPSLPPPIPTTTEPLAICSLILSLAGLVCCAIVTAIPGVICGHIALSRIARQPQLQGKGMAIAGLIIGYAAIAIGIAYLVFVVGVSIFGALTEAAK